MRYFILSLLFAFPVFGKAQTSYIEIVSHVSMTSSFVYIDIGKAKSYYLYESGEKVKFRTGIECVRYLSVRGWRLVSAYSHEIDTANFLTGRGMSPISKCYVMCKDFENGKDPVDDLELMSEIDKNKNGKNKKSKSNDDMYQ